MFEQSRWRCKYAQVLLPARTLYVLSRLLSLINSVFYCYNIWINLLILKDSGLNQVADVQKQVREKCHLDRLKEAVEFAGNIYEHFAILEQAFKSEAQPFKKNLKDFLQGMDEVVHQVERIAGGTVVGTLKVPTVRQMDLIDTLVDKTPDSLLIPVWVLMESMPGYAKHQKKTIEFLSTLPSDLFSNALDGTNVAGFRLDAKQHNTLVAIRAVVQLVNTTFEKSKDLFPRDRSATAEAGTFGSQSSIENFSSLSISPARGASSFLAKSRAVSRIS